MEIRQNFRINNEILRGLTMEEAIDVCRYMCLKAGAEIRLYGETGKNWYLLGEYYHLGAKSQQPYQDKDENFVRQCIAVPCLPGIPYTNERIRKTL